MNLKIASLSLTLLALTSACTPLGYRAYDAQYEVGRSTGPAANIEAEISSLVDELASMAEVRTALGSVSVVVDDLVPLPPTRRQYLQPALERESERNTEATLRHELEMALAGTMNVVGGTVVTEAVSGESAGTDLAERAARVGATHGLIGTFQRDGRDVEVSLQLVELRSEWLVATARRRIVRFEADGFGRANASAAARAPKHFAGAERTKPSVREASVPEPCVTVETGPDTSVIRGSVALDSRADGVPSGQVTFDTGPAATRLRAIGPVSITPTEAEQADDPAEQPVDEERLPD